MSIKLGDCHTVSTWLTFELQNKLEMLHYFDSLVKSLPGSITTRIAGVQGTGEWEMTAKWTATYPVIISWNIYQLLRVSNTQCSCWTIQIPGPRGSPLKHGVFLYVHLAAHLFTGLSLEGSLVLELVMKREETEAKGVWRVVEGHLHIRTVLGDIQGPRLPDWKEKGPKWAPQGHPTPPGWQHVDKNSYTYRVCRPGCPAVTTGHRLLTEIIFLVIRQFDIFRAQQFNKYK